MTICQPKMDVQNTISQGALIISGFIPEEHLWNGLSELLNEIEDLPQPVPWRCLGTLPIEQLHISVHRKRRSGDISPPIEWAASALASPKVCAAIAINCEPPANYEPLGDDLVQNFSIATIECLFQDFANIFTFAANIARPGCFNVSSIVWRCADGSCNEEPGLCHSLSLAVDFSRKTGWPPLGSVPFRSVYAWIVRNLFHLRVGDTPVSRAFNAYTWLFGERGLSPFGLVSALIGLEALFGTSTSGVADQIRRRAQLLLGSGTSFDKELNRMYAARSALLHGSTPLILNGFSWNVPEIIESKRNVSMKMRHFHK